MSFAETCAKMQLIAMLTYYGDKWQGKVTKILKIEQQQMNALT